MPPLDLRLGDVVRLRREHPCGSHDFEVVRLGADIGLRCQRCGRRILLARSLLERRMSGFASRAPDPMAPMELDLSGLEDPEPGPNDGAAGQAADNATAGHAAGGAVPKPGRERPPAS